MVMDTQGPTPTPDNLETNKLIQQFKSEVQQGGFIDDEGTTVDDLTKSCVSAITMLFLWAQKSAFKPYHCEILVKSGHALEFCTRFLQVVAWRFPALKLSPRFDRHPHRPARMFTTGYGHSVVLYLTSRRKPHAPKPVEILKAIRRD